MTVSYSLEELIRAVRSSPKYAAVSVEAVTRVCAVEHFAGLPFKLALKGAKNKLHQVGGAYLPTRRDYDAWRGQLSAAAGNPVNVKAVITDILSQHTSTRERLDLLDTFYSTCLESIAPIHSLLDLACGLNPLTLPWLPLAPRAEVRVCDIYADLVSFLDFALKKMGYNAQAFTTDLILSVPQKPAQLALLLKALPCLEQQDKHIAARLLASIPTDHILVSFPVRSLGGRGKGMPAFYEAHLHEVIQGLNFSILRFEFEDELAFLLSRPVPINEQPA